MPDDRGKRDDRPPATTTITRRTVLAAAFGTGAAALLAACRDGGSDDGAAASTAAPSATGAPPSRPQGPPPGGSGAPGGPPPGAGGGDGGGGGEGGGTMNPDTGLSAVPEETAGPFPGDGSNGVDALAQDGIVRSDIRSSFGSGSATADGVTMTLRMRIVDVATGQAVEGAAVYVWHCDAGGSYSMYSPDVTAENYLRGVQVAGADGTVTFTSIYPACYAGRWPHIHYEVYPDVAAVSDAGAKIATSQLALPDDANAAVYATERYAASEANYGRVSLATDMVFSDGTTNEVPTVTGDVDAGYTVAITAPVDT